MVKIFKEIEKGRVTEMEGFPRWISTATREKASLIEKYQKWMENRFQGPHKQAEIQQARIHEERNGKKICKYHNRGYCKFNRRCRYIHVHNVCETYLKDGDCHMEGCRSRHHRRCRQTNRQTGVCIRGPECLYLHKLHGTIQEEMRGEIRGPQKH